MMTIMILVQLASPSNGQPPATSAAPARTWDFSASRSITRVPWPKDRASSTFFHLRGKSPVKVVFTAHRVFHRHVELVTFYRLEEKIDLVIFSLEEQTLDDVYKTAKQLALAWELPIEKLDEWHEATKAGQYKTLAITRNDLTPQVSLEIWKSFDDERPWAITFQVGWVMEQLREHMKRFYPSTQPTTQPDAAD